MAVFFMVNKTLLRAFYLFNCRLDAENEKNIWHIHRMLCLYMFIGYFVGKATTNLKSFQRK